MLSQFLHIDPNRSWIADAACTPGIVGKAGVTGRTCETQRQLVAHSERLAARIGAVASGQRVVLSCRRARSFVPGLFASWLAGATVELLPNVQPATLDRVDADDDVAAVLHDDPVRARRSPKALYVPELLADRGVAATLRAPWPEVAVRMTTSGTTNIPKVVAKTTAQLANELATLTQIVPAATCAMSTVPLSHLYGLLWGALLPLRIGARIASHAALLPADVRVVLEREAADLLISTPAHLRAMVAVAMPRHLRAISSGARLAAELHTSLAHAHAWHVTDVFGSTETGGIAERSDPVSAWTPLPTVAVSAVDHQLVVESPWCARTVLDDHIALDPDGKFRHLGRSAAVVKIAGKRADAQAIEAAVLGVQGVVDAALIVRDIAGREPRIAMAIVTATPASPVRRAAIVEAIRDQFDDVFVPRTVTVVANIPRTDRGKIDRAALQAMLFPDRSASGGSADACIAIRRVAPGHYAADVPRDLVFFRGHFDAAPVLPGAVVIERLVWPVVREEWPDVGALRGIRRLKFRRPVFPGQQLSVTVTRNAGTVAVDVATAASSVASAQLLVE